MAKKFSEEEENTCIDLGEFFKIADEVPSGNGNSDESDSSDSADEMSYLHFLAENDEKKRLRDEIKLFEEIEIEFVETSLNYQGNYQNYVTRVLKSLLPLQVVNFENLVKDRIEKIEKTENFEKIQKTTSPLKMTLSQKMTPHEKTTPPQNKKTLILDLDETLIHADFDGNWSQHDHTVYFHYEGHQVSVPIIIRPGVFQFLEKISEIF
jgi:TFIIF-interacting CTD phosphatase-like protein